MPQYLLSIYQPDGEPPPPEILEPIVAGVRDLEQQLKSAGCWVFDAGLFPPPTATVVKVEAGEAVITDGPYVEGKEHIGGFSVITAPDLDAALHWARKFAEITTLPVEVRPLLTADGS